MAYRIVAEDVEKLNRIILDVRKWFIESRDFKCKSDT